jgi:hypothetical protein
MSMTSNNFLNSKRDSNVSNSKRESNLENSKRDSLRSLTRRNFRKTKKIYSQDRSDKKFKVLNILNSKNIKQ